MKQLEERTMKKVFRRLVPFLMLCYFFNFLDRVNVSFAALDMNKDLGFSASVFGFGSGSCSSPICYAKPPPTLF
jgi:MFS transporter, ACS family, tartrate transporter